MFVTISLRMLGLRLDFLDRVVEIAHHQHDLDAGIVDLVLDLARAVERIGRHHHPAQLQDSKICHHKLRRVGHENPHPVALLHTQLRQPGSQAIGEIVHLLVGDLVRL